MIHKTERRREMTLAALLVVIGIIAAIGGATVFVAGEHFGYRKGVRDTVRLNDEAYKSRLSAETEEYRKRGENQAEALRKQLAALAEYGKDASAPRPMLVNFPGTPDQNKLA
jgi:hypothetical protein